MRTYNILVTGVETLIFHVENLNDMENKPCDDCFRMKLKEPNGNEVEVWGIRINTLEELIRFQNEAASGRSLLLTWSALDHMRCIQYHG